MEDSVILNEGTGGEWIATIEEQGINTLHVCLCECDGLNPIFSGPLAGTEMCDHNNLKLTKQECTDVLILCDWLEEQGIYRDATKILRNGITDERMMTVKLRHLIENDISCCLNTLDENDNIIPLKITS